MILTLLCLLACAEAYLVVVLGDIHGDFDNMIAMLRNNGILDSRNRWRNTWDKVISVGDLIGRGHQDRRVLEFVYEQQQARPGQWIQLLGNHEIMQVSSGILVRGACVCVPTFFRCTHMHTQTHSKTTVIPRTHTLSP